ncbi:methyltransferase domain-containing protein [Streptomyces sp. CB02460]|uniref:methyltransferase domain-containing protein n=1 Tax=Streptomyces sp. CB02460 TaxID=1703941 RepID=UPI00093A6DDB|nr:methyltransferase domain-containing protein [Streptomyces sp. CB02460]OKJ76114.1 protein-L-isoaspartate(D-aspartate) O-methyltransferase [Streptomyces sp. CB02460]
MSEQTVSAYATREDVAYALTTGGVLKSGWLDAYVRVPRQAFLPDTIWPYDMATGRTVHVSRTEDAQAWRGYADADVPIVTQWDDGEHAGREPGRVSTSSASMPSVVFRMLDALTVDDYCRVLEIGTGTGWNAALLAHKVGEGNVVSVEVDEAVANRAREALDHFFGAPVEVIHGDGRAGAPGRGVFDRVIATCGVREIPYAWVEQTRPGGVIVAPWGTDFSPADAVLRLTVDAEGKSASGRFTGPVEFMKLRAHRSAPIDHEAYAPGPLPAPEATTSDAARALSAADRFSSLTFVLGLRVPACTYIAAEKVRGAQPHWFYSRNDRSWACVLVEDGRPAARVWQRGRRRLWDEVEGAYAWWVERGRPGWERFGVTVWEEGERVWVDEVGEWV